MMGLGLSAANQKKFHTLLTSNHNIAISVGIYTLSHAGVSTVTSYFIDGSITIDTTQEVTRSASLTFFDPYHKMGLDAYAPGDGALFIDRMIGIWYVVTDTTDSTKYTVPVFMGPITKVDRDWVTVQVECQGKEVLSLNPAWNPKTYRKGAYKTAVIRDLLLNTGEKKYTIPAGLKAKLPNNLAMSNETKPWALAKSLAAGMGYQLFYDGRGVAVMRPWPRTSAWVYNESGADFSVVTKPQVGYDLSKLINAVIVKGVAVKGKKKTPITVKKYAPRTHPLSPWAIGRNGVSRYLFETVSDDTINSITEANSVATTHLNRGLIEPIVLSFDALPIPHLEPGDMYKLVTEEFSQYAILHQMTIPLVVGGVSTVGYLRNTTKPNVKTIRKNRR